MGLWDGYVTFLKNKRIYPTGLFEYIQEATSLNIEILEDYTDPQLDFNTKASPFLLQTKSMIDEYSYQYTTLLDCLEKRRGILHLATGSGKTFIAAALAVVINKPTLFLVHTLDLMRQTYEVLKNETDLNVGMLGGGHEDKDIQVLISTTKSLFNKIQKEKYYKKYIKSVFLVFADECHLASANQYLKILNSCENAPYRFGLSGTPLRHDEIRNMKLIGALGPVISRVKNKKLISLGVNATPIINIFTIEKTNKEFDPYDYNSCYKNNIIHNEYRNNKILEIIKKEYNKEKTILVLVKHIEHGELLEKSIKENGIPIRFVCGQTEKETRYLLLDEMKRQERRVLILSAIGEVGLDIPDLDCILRASGGKSSISTLQAIGRGLRRKKDENVVSYYDFLDSVDRYTYSHSMQRIKDYEQEEFEVVVRGE